MNYKDRLRERDTSRARSRSVSFIKLAEEREDRGRALRDLALVGAGTAIGGGAGYGLTSLLRSRYGQAIDASSPDKRIKWLTPAAALVGGAMGLTGVLRQRAESRSKKSKK